jgi:hypothetical protein
MTCVSCGLLRCMSGHLTKLTMHTCPLRFGLQVFLEPKHLLSSSRSWIACRVCLFRLMVFGMTVFPFMDLQAADINALFGFRLECVERLGDQAGVYAWTRFNALFNWLPLAALIEDRILCMHGGGLITPSTRPS